MVDEFSDGDVVWVKCGTLFWPARVVDYKNLPDDIKEDFPDGAEKPKIIAKFFDEDGYEYLFDNKNILPYNSSKKEEFIKKGLAKSRTKSKEGATSGWFAKFPKDVIESEKLTGGDLEILDKAPYADKPSEKVNYKELFGSGQQKKTVAAETPKAAVGKKRKADSSPMTKKSPAASSPAGKRKKTAPAASPVKTPARPIVHPRFKDGGAASDHKVKILPQPSAPYHIDLQMKQEKLTSAAPNAYTCHICGFSATRINVIVLHSKSHSEPAKSNASAAGGRASASGTPTRKSAASTPASTSKSKKPSAAAASKAKAKATPAKKAATTPAAVSATTATPKSGRRGKAASNDATPVAATPAAEIPKRRGRPPAAAKTATPSTSAPATAAATPSTTETAVPAKKGRMTKKKKEALIQEKEKKEEERKAIMGDWMEEEEDEAEERRKINESLGKNVDDSDDDSDRDAYLGDDHVHGYDDDDDDDEVEPMEMVEEKKTEEKIEKNGEKKKGEEKKENGTKEKIEEKKPEESKEAEADVTAELEMPSFDIDKVLAETSMPSLSSDIESVVKKSVKFSPKISKEIALKTIRVMQPESNLIDPEDVDDEFAFTEEPKIPELMSTKTILKRSRAKDSPFKQPDATIITAATSKPTVKLTFNAPAEELTDEDKEDEAMEREEQEAAEAEPIPAEDEPMETAEPAEAPVEETVAVTTADLTSTIEAVPTTANIVLQTTEGGHIQVHNGAVADGGEHDGETYFLVVEDDDNAGAHLDSLNSQTLYIDSSSLANGDLSNVVLMTGPPHPVVEAHHEAPTAVTFATATTPTPVVAGGDDLAAATLATASMLKPADQ